jgi:hypothetical protein
MLAMKLNIFLDVDSSFRSKAEYVFRTFFLFREVQLEFFYAETGNVDFDIYYGEKSENRYPISVFHNSCAVEFYKNRDKYLVDDLNFLEFEGVRLPFLFSTFDDCSVAKQDIIASAFYFLSGWQELNDQSEPYRYDFYSSLQYNAGFTEMPVVDYYFFMLERAIEKYSTTIRDIKKLTNLPNLFNYNTDFSYTLSHDIDYFDTWNPRHLKKIYQHNFSTFRSRPLRATYKILAHFFTKQLGWNPEKHLASILRTEDKLGVKSISFLMASACNDIDRQNYIDDEVLCDKLLKMYKNQVVGLHGTREASLNELELTSQLEKLKSKGFDVRGYRNHYLYYDYQRTFSILEKLDFEFDSTLGFHENIGYRVGYSMPFYPYNIADDRAFRILEIPLVVMDVTLFASPDAEKRCLELINHARKTQGHISLLWHNYTYDSVDFPGWGKLYWKLVKNMK